MPKEGITILSSLVVGLSFLTIGGPFVGELVATMPPIFIVKQAILSVQELSLPYEEVSFITMDGITLRGWYFPSDDENAPAILYAPATSKDQRSGLSLVRPFHQAGFNVLLFSYRGHGLSDGHYHGFTYGARESLDVDAAVRYLNDEKGIRKIGAIGHSAGAVSIILSAARNPQINAVVAASPFRSMEEIWKTNSPAFLPPFFMEFMMRMSELIKGFSRDQIRPQDVIADIAPRPLLIIHSSDDRRITVEQATNLYNAAAEPKTMWLTEGASHAQVRSVVMNERIQEIVDFFRDALLSNSSRAHENPDPL
jgi:dipeptidyl aminopeptidase/acylaminoacyl peptidase